MCIDLTDWLTDSLFFLASLFFVTYEATKHVLGTSIDPAYTPLIHMVAASCGEVVSLSKKKKVIVCLWLMDVVFCMIRRPVVYVCLPKSSNKECKPNNLTQHLQQFPMWFEPKEFLDFIGAFYRRWHAKSLLPVSNSHCTNTSSGCMLIIMVVLLNLIKRLFVDLWRVALRLLSLLLWMSVKQESCYPAR